MPRHTKHSFCSKVDKTESTIEGASRRGRAPFFYSNVNPNLVEMSCEYGTHTLNLLGYFILLKCFYMTGFITKTQAKAYLIGEVMGIGYKTVWSKLEQMEERGWVEFKKNGSIRLFSSRMKKKGQNLHIYAPKDMGEVISQLREEVISKTIRKQAYKIKETRTNSQFKHVALRDVSNIPLGVKGMAAVLKCSKSTASIVKKQFRFIAVKHDETNYGKLSEEELSEYQIVFSTGKLLRRRSGNVWHIKADRFTQQPKNFAKTIAKPNAIAKKATSKDKNITSTIAAGVAVKTKEERQKKGWSREEEDDYIMREMKEEKRLGYLAVKITTLLVKPLRYGHAGSDLTSS